MPTPRKSNRLRALQGEKPRLAPVYPVLEDEEPPSWLPPEAAEEWHRVLGIASHHEGLVQVLDRPALLAYVVTWSTWLVAAKDVADRGPVVPGRSSADAARGEDTPAMVKNPSVQVMRDAGIQLRHWCREFGFTPDARGRMDIPDNKQPSAGERFFT